MLRTTMLSLVLLLALMHFPTVNPLRSILRDVADSFVVPIGDQAGFDYPISDVNNPTRQRGDNDGWYVDNDFGRCGFVWAGCCHPGDDWNKEGGSTADVGEVVKAVADGRIENIRDLGPLGWGIAISHQYQGATYYSVYIHVLPRSDISDGQIVTRGQPIATIGSFSGVSPHLHFEMRTQMNPDGDWYPTDIDCDGDGRGDGYYPSLSAILSAGYIDPVEFIDANRPVGCQQANAAIRVFNVDDVATAYVNGVQVVQRTYRQDSGLVDISNYLRAGNNTVRFTLENRGGGYTYGFEVRVNDRLVFSEQCGQAGTVGCNNNDTRGGIVYDKTISIPLIDVSPGSGPPGTTFTVQGKGFTPNRTITSHLLRPDGTEFLPLNLTTDSNGEYTHPINSTNFSLGTYQHWVEDDATCLVSARVNFIVSATSSVHIFYYPWYGNPATDGAWRHWQQNNHRPPDDIAANYYPVLGAYSSNDQNVVDAHMSAIAYSGVGVVVTSWWGQGSFEDRVVPKLLDSAATNGLKVAFHIEPYSGRTADSVRNDIAYIYNRYGNHPAFFRVSRPTRYSSSASPRGVFYIFSSTAIPDADWRRVTDNIRGTQLDAILLGQGPGVDANSYANYVTATHLDGLYNYDVLTVDGSAYSSISSRLTGMNAIFAPSVGPGYIDSRAVAGSTRSKSRANGATYDQMWQRAIDSGAEWISITSFNEWHEGTQIEPAMSKSIPGFTYLNYEGAYGLTEYYDAETAYIDHTLSMANLFSVAPVFRSEVRRMLNDGFDLVQVMQGSLDGVNAHSACVFKKRGEFFGAFTIRLYEYDQQRVRTFVPGVYGCGDGGCDESDAFAFASIDTTHSFTDTNGDGLKELFIRTGTGGNCFDCSPSVLFQISNHELRRIAQGPIGDIADLNQDGISELLVIDIRWEFYQDLCHACSPGSIMVYGWSNGEYVYVSPDFPSFYDQRIRETRQRVNEEAAQLPDSEEPYVGACVSLLIDYAHKRDLVPGWTEFNALMQRSITTQEQRQLRQRVLEDLQYGDGARMLREPQYGEPLRWE